MRSTAGSAGPWRTFASSPRGIEEPEGRSTGVRSDLVQRFELGVRTQIRGLGAEVDHAAGLDRAALS